MAEPMCQILLDNQWNTFDAGGVITGHVKIHLVKEKTVRCKSIVALSGFEKFKRGAFIRNIYF